MDSQALVHYQQSAQDLQDIKHLLNTQSAMLTAVITSSTQTLQPPKPALRSRRTNLPTAQTHSNPRNGESVYQSPLLALGCNCPKRPRGARNTFPRSFAFIFYRTSSHLPNCPFSLPVQQSTTMGARFVLSRRGVGYLVEAALTWGAESICPRIACRNIVPYFSPAFALARAFGRLVANEDDDAYVADALVLSHKCLANLFRNGRARPSDVLSDGSTLLHVSLALSAVFDMRAGVAPRTSPISFPQHLSHRNRERFYSQSI
jgi:hypothetical protein